MRKTGLPSGAWPSGSSLCVDVSSIFSAVSSVSSSGGVLLGNARPPIALLQERPVAADAHEDLRLPLGLADEHAADVAGLDLVGLARDQVLQPLLILAKIEVREVLEGIELAAADGVELVFHLGGELVVDQVRQMRFEQLRNGEGRPGRHQHVAALRT